jgi:hypothetical protein
MIDTTSHQIQEEEMKAARKARIESYRGDLRAVLLKRDLIKKDAIKTLEEQKINHLKAQIS